MSTVCPLQQFWSRPESVAMVTAERLELIVRGLLAMKAPKARSEQVLILNPVFACGVSPWKVLIVLVLLVGWLGLLERGRTPEDYEVIDFFAGAARIARASRELGFGALAFDIGYHNDPHVFDINSSAGLVCLSCTHARP